MLKSSWSPETRRVLLIAAAIIAVFVIGALVWREVLSAFGSTEEIVRWLGSVRSAWWAPVVYLLLYAIFNVLFIPTQVLSIAAALTWGWKLGASIELVAATLAAVPPFLISRAATERWLAKLGDHHVKWLDRISENGLFAMLLLRFVPIVPYTALNYLAGCADIRKRHYLLATFVGMIPSTFLFAYFVEALWAGIMTPSQAFVRILGAGAMLAALTIITKVIARRMHDES